MNVFEGKGLLIRGLRFLAPREAYDILVAGEAVLVDLREDYLVAVKRFSVPGLVYVPHRDLPDVFASLSKDLPLIVADSAGVYTKDAALFLQAHRYDQVACLNGGMLAWDEAGMPVATDASALLHGDCACVMRPREPKPDR
jgi:rhodanese-related sulfurtransferase